MLLFFHIIIKKKNNDSSIDIRIEFTEAGFKPSATFDLLNDSYTINYLDKPSLSVKMNLTVSEKKEIIDQYYFFGLDQIKGTKEFKDKCLRFPKNRTIIKVLSKNQEIGIDDTCDDFSLSDYSEVKHVKDFLDFINNLFKKET